MSYRIGLVVIVLVCVALGGYWLYSNIPLYALAASDGYEWSLQAVGWSMFYSAAFIAPALVIAGALSVLGVMALTWLYSKALNADRNEALARQKMAHDQQIQQLETRLKLAKEQAEQAEQLAKERYQAATDKANRLTQQAAADIAKAQSMMEKAEALAKRSLLETQQAQKDARRAEKKKNNAMGAAERLKRREARRQGQQE